MRVYYSDTFPFPLPAGHHFPADKYRLLRERLLATPDARGHELLEAPRVTRRQLALVHDLAYVDAFCSGTLDAAAQRRIGLPWSAELVERSLRSCGATVAAARAAWREGAAIYLAGGTHHAHRDFGAGYCVFNDCAVAARVLQSEGVAGRVLIFDTDVHQGDGTAALFARDPSVFTCSIHGARNFPSRKQRSDLDLPLADGTGDTEFLAAVRDGLRRSFAAARPAFVFYLAGADAWHGDALGRLAVSAAALAHRDAMVLQACADADVPWVVVMGGGYAPDIRDSVQVYLQTVLAALTLAPRLRS
ncbi:MAG: histone deacetylase [Planctomycetota bacterium]